MIHFWSEYFKVGKNEQGTGCHAVKKSFSVLRDDYVFNRESCSPRRHVCSSWIVDYWVPSSAANFSNKCEFDKILIHRDIYIDVSDLLRRLFFRHPDYGCSTPLWKRGSFSMPISPCFCFDSAGIFDSKECQWKIVLILFRTRYHRRNHPICNPQQVARSASDRNYIAAENRQHRLWRYCGQHLPRKELKQMLVPESL